MEVLEKALVHTLLGMGSVFIVLILIFVIISLFSFIPKIQAMFGRTKLDPGPDPSAAPKTPAAPVLEVAEEADETDDLALVAVITAAIAASTGTGTDGFVVRSIRRAPASRWKK